MRRRGITAAAGETSSSATGPCASSPRPSSARSSRMRGRRRAMRHRVVLFDIDNTLLTSGGAGRRALERAVLEETGIAADLFRVAYAGRTDPAILRDLLDVCGIEAVAGRVERIFERYVAHLDREVGDGAECALCPGVEAAVAALAGRAGGQLGGP